MVTSRGVRAVRQERSAARRDALLRAAVELIVDGGIKAVTHRAVSARAGVPAATAGNYFKTSQDLVEEALRFHVAERADTLGAVLRGAVDGAGSLAEVGQRVAEALVRGDSGVTVAQYEVYLEAARNPAFSDAVATSVRTFEQVAAGVLAGLGVRRPERAARAFVAVADGFAVRRLANPLPADEDTELMVDTLAGLFLANVLDREELLALLPGLPGKPS